MSQTKIKRLVLTETTIDEIGQKIAQTFGGGYNSTDKIVYVGSDSTTGWKVIVSNGALFLACVYAGNVVATAGEKVPYAEGAVGNAIIYYVKTENVVVFSSHRININQDYLYLCQGAVKGIDNADNSTKWIYFLTQINSPYYSRHIYTEHNTAPVNINNTLTASVNAVSLSPVILSLNNENMDIVTTEYLYILNIGKNVAQNVGFILDGEEYLNTAVSDSTAAGSAKLVVKLT